MYAQNDLSKMNMKGKVKSDTCFYYDVFDQMGKDVLSYRDKEALKFNSIGNIEEITYFNERNNPTKKIANSYHDKQLYQTDTLFDNAYDSHRALLFYDNIGRLNQRAIYQSNGMVLRKSFYSYLDNGLLSEIKNYSSNGNYEGYVAYNYEYHKNGKVAAIYSSEGKLTFDSLGHYIGDMFFKNSEQPDGYKYLYNENGDIICNEHGQTFQYSYDANGNVTLRIKSELKFEKITPVERSIHRLHYY